MKYLLPAIMFCILPALAQETTVQLPGDAQMTMVWIGRTRLRPHNLPRPRDRRNRDCRRPAGCPSYSLCKSCAKFSGAAQMHVTSAGVMEYAVSGLSAPP